MGFSYGGFKGGGGKLPAGNAQTIASGFIAIHLDLQRLSRQLNYAEQMMKVRMQAAAIRSGQMAGKNFGKSFSSGLRTGMNNVGNMLIRNLGHLATSAFAGGGAFAKFGITVAAEMEQAEISMQTLLDSMSAGSQLFNEVKSMALETPFEFPELRDAAKLLAVKVPQSNIVSSLKMLGDLASGTGGDIKELAFAYEKIFGSERVQNYWLRMFERRGLPIYKELADQLKVSQTQVFEMARKGEIGFKEVDKALRSMTQSGGAFFQMTDRLSTSLQGQFNKLQDSIKEMGRQVGESLRPATELFTQGAMIMLPRLGAALNDFFEHLTDERIIKWASNLAEVLGDLVDALNDAGKGWSKAQAGLASADYEAGLFSLNHAPMTSGQREQLEERVAGQARHLAEMFPGEYRLNSKGDRIIPIPDQERRHYTRNKLRGMVDEMSHAAAAYRAKKATSEAEREKSQKNRYHDNVMDAWRKEMRTGPYKYTDELNSMMNFLGKGLPGRLGNTLKAGGLGIAQALMAITAGPGMDLEAKKKKQENIMEGGFTAFEDLNRNIQETLLSQATDKKIEKNTKHTNVLLEDVGQKLGKVVANTSRYFGWVP